VKYLSGDATTLCRTLRKLTSDPQSCYTVGDADLDAFLFDHHNDAMGATWRSFRPPDTGSRKMTTLQIFKGIRRKQYEIPSGF